MQARVKCPACQTTLGVDVAHGRSALLRCPQCQHEFAIRLRPSLVGAPNRQPAGDSLPPPRPVMPPRPAHNPPSGQPAEEETQSGVLLWIGICAGMALAIVVLVATMMLSDVGGKMAQNPVDATVQSEAGSSSTAPPASQSVSSPAPVASGPIPGGLVLAYRFNSGEEYAYAFTMKAEAAGKVDEARGGCSLRACFEQSPSGFAQPQQIRQGNGSGFVVTSDGYIVTCAHVVEGSTKIEVVLGTQTYDGKVVAFDKQHDLAVLRITAADLPTVSLANSDTVQLGEEVRAVGFPLSTVLGESVKVTRGTIAGTVDRQGVKFFQVDASINPGNSGGPLVNERGQVVGVTSARLAGRGIDGVGFVVPASEALSLLRRKSIAVSSAAPGPKLDGPALARQVTPAVAMIKVTIGPGGYGANSRVSLDVVGEMLTIVQAEIFGSIQGGISTHSTTGKLRLSEHGEVIDDTSGMQLPYLLGPIATFAIEPLGSGDQRAWQTQHAAVLTSTGLPQKPSPMSLQIRRRSGSPLDKGSLEPHTVGPIKVVSTPAMETSNYEVTGTNGDVVTIVKRYTFETLDPPGSPTTKVTGEGTTTFNWAKGYAEKMDYKATLVRNVGNSNATVPLTMTWRRLPPGQFYPERGKAQADLTAVAAARFPKRLLPKAGEDTPFAGGPGGHPQRMIDDSALLYGVVCVFNGAGDRECLHEIAPIFDRNQPRWSFVGDVAREGYAVGAVEIYAESSVNALRLIFMRVKGGRRLDPADSYTGQWLGTPRSGPPQTLTGGGAAVIGIHLRRAIIVDAMALVIDRNAR